MDDWWPEKGGRLVGEAISLIFKMHVCASFSDREVTRGGQRVNLARKREERAVNKLIKQKLVALYNSLLWLFHFFMLVSILWLHLYDYFGLFYNLLLILFTMLLYFWIDLFLCCGYLLLCFTSMIAASFFITLCVACLPNFFICLYYGIYCCL